MTKRLISFSDPQYLKLQERAGKLGLSVSELVRRIVDQGLDTKPWEPYSLGLMGQTEGTKETAMRDLINEMRSLL